jgi:hypothetical protein
MEFILSNDRELSILNQEIKNQKIIKKNKLKFLKRLFNKFKNYNH